MNKLISSSLCLMFLSASFVLSTRVVADSPMPQDQNLFTCRGKKYTAKVYIQGGTPNIQLINNSDGIQFYNSAARRETSSSAINYTGIRGENSYRVSQVNNSNKCYVQVGTQPRDQGLQIKDSSFGGSGGSSDNSFGN